MIEETNGSVAQGTGSRESSLPEHALPIGRNAAEPRHSVTPHVLPQQSGDEIDRDGNDHDPEEIRQK